MTPKDGTKISTASVKTVQFITKIASGMLLGTPGWWCPHQYKTWTCHTYHDILEENSHCWLL